MKISIDDQEIFTLSETQKKVIKNDIRDELFLEDIKRRILYYPQHKYDECFKRLKNEWEPRLKEKGVASIPLNDDAFAELVFSQSDYKNRSQRESM